MKNDILIIGFGNIGQRHFQSFYNLNKKFNIFIIYKKIKNKSALIKNKYYKNRKVKVKVFDNLVKLKKKKFFLSIVATNSDVRFFIFKKLVNQFKSKHIILEKVLFKNSNEFKRCTKFIENYPEKIWVNLPRREHEIIQYINSRLDKKKKIFIKFSGYEWGMASNMIHFLDLFKWITKAKKITFQKKLENKIYKAKRKGFYEVRGKILFKDQSNNELKIIDNKNFTKNKLEIRNKKNVFIINDNILHQKLKNKKIVKIFSNNLQSNLTSKIYYSLVENNFCKLPEFKSSIDIHKIFYSILDKKMKKKLFT